MRRAVPSVVSSHNPGLIVSKQQNSPDWGTSYQTAASALARWHGQERQGMERMEETQEGEWLDAAWVPGLTLEKEKDLRGKAGAVG